MIYQFIKPKYGNNGYLALYANGKKIAQGYLDARSVLDAINAIVLPDKCVETDGDGDGGDYPDEISLPKCSGQVQALPLVEGDLMRRLREIMPCGTTITITKEA